MRLLPILYQKHTFHAPVRFEQRLLNEPRMKSICEVLQRLNLHLFDKWKDMPGKPEVKRVFHWINSSSKLNTKGFLVVAVVGFVSLIVESVVGRVRVV
jgi:hypothetical protein